MSFFDAAKTSKIASGADVRDSLLTNLTASWNGRLAHPWNPELMLAIDVDNDKIIKTDPIYRARSGVGP